MGHAKNCTSGDCLCHRYKAQLKDKHTPILGEMDTIDCLRKERDELRAENADLKNKLNAGFCSEGYYRYESHLEEVIAAKSRQIESLQLSRQQRETLLGELVEALDGLLDGLDANHDPDRLGLTVKEWVKRVKGAEKVLRSVEQGQK